MTFKKEKETYIETLDMHVQEFSHPSGIRHIHLFRKDPELGFSVGFRTPPDSDNGRSHILEHLTLSGSKNYPVRDPFFAMTRRSVASFMNAETYPDRTVYPFNSPNKQDYKNLMGIYLDATFFPLLNELDFKQEGWRFEVVKDDMGKNKLEIQGVVYNEMKGAYDNPKRIQYKGMIGAIRQGTSYDKDSGGDPKSIPTITHQNLVDFHHSHYHPSRAVVTTYGDITALEIQEILHEKVLSKIKDEKFPPLPFEKVNVEALEASKNVFFQASEDSQANEYAFYMSWLRAPVNDIKKVIMDTFMSKILFANKSSPFIQKISMLGFGEPGEMPIFTDGLGETSLSLGMSGLSEKECEKAKIEFWNILKGIAKDGISQDFLDSGLRNFQLMISNTESNTPFGYNLIGDALTQALFDGDVAFSLDSKRLLDYLNSEISLQKVKEWISDLINAPHVEINMIPDPLWLKNRHQFEIDYIESISQNFNPKDWESVQSLQDAVYASQAAPSPIETLPMIAIGDLSSTPLKLDEVENHPKNGFALHQHISVDSRGIGEMAILVDTSSLPKEDWLWVSAWSYLATQMGAGDLNWQENSQKLEQEGRGIQVEFSPLSDTQYPNQLRTVLTIQGESLEKYASNLGFGLTRVLMQTRWDDVERLKFVVKNLLRNIQASPGDLIPIDLGRGMLVTADFQAQTGGPLSLPFWLEFMNHLDSNPSYIKNKLEKIQNMLSDLPCQVRTIGGSEVSNAGQILQSSLETRLSFNPSKKSHFNYERNQIDFSNLAWTANQQVGQMYQIFEAPSQSTPDAFKIQVLMKIMTGGYLHSAIREKGGAYGGGASAGRLITFSSYRDPRVEGTFEDFNKSIDWAQSGSFSQREVDEGILSVIKNLDKPSTPRSKALSSWAVKASNLTDEKRQEFRSAILNTTHSELQKLAQDWLSKPYSRLASLPSSKINEAEKMGMEVRNVLPSKAKKLKLG